MVIIPVMAAVTMTVIVTTSVMVVAAVVRVAGPAMVVVTSTVIVIMTLGGNCEAAGEQGHRNECAMDDFHHGLPVSDAADTMLAATSSIASVGTGG
ncbi:MAG: hypothetical protein M3Y93_07065 [Pseudomonadota bacterium]|nr:hypothetical protein [Pseudomonadota bacterium]